VTPSFACAPAVPRSPDCYAFVHQDRIRNFPACEEFLFNPRQIDPEDLDTKIQGWRHGLEHDAESVFWLLVYWAVVAQPKGHKKEDIDAVVWGILIGDSPKRQIFIRGLSDGLFQNHVTHSVYEPLEALINKLASFLVVDRCWLPASDVRSYPEYLNEAFQRSILQFILDHNGADFMNCAVDTIKTRTVEGVPQSQKLSSTLNQDKDEADRSEARQLFHRVGCECGSLNSCLFLFYSQGMDDSIMEDSDMEQ
jgi:hypothetical protein